MKVEITRTGAGLVLIRLLEQSEISHLKRHSADLVGNGFDIAKDALEEAVDTD